MNQQLHLACVTRACISLRNIANIIGNENPNISPIRLIPTVFRRTCLNLGARIGSVNILIKCLRPTHFEPRNPRLGLQSWNAISHPASGIYAKIISHITNGTDSRNRYRCSMIFFHMECEFANLVSCSFMSLILAPQKPKKNLNIFYCSMQFLH